MLAYRIALTGAIAVLAAPATALASNAGGATPTATPLLVELAVAAVVAGAVLARRRLTAFARAGASRLAQQRARRHPARRPRVSER